MSIYSLCSEESGIFVGVTVGTTDPLVLEQNTPAGHRAIAGEFDHLSQRVDLAAMAIRDAAIAAANTALAASTTEEELNAATAQLDAAMALPVVVDYQPPAPPNDEMQTWSWSARKKRWVSAPTLSALKATKWEEIKRARATAEAAGFTWDGSVFDSNPASQSHLQGAAWGAHVAGEAFTITWTLADNTNRTLNYSDMLAVGTANAAHIQAVRLQSRTLRAALDAATTEEEVSSIDWGGGP